MKKSIIEQVVEKPVEHRELHVEQTKIATIKVKIVGTSPLLQNALSERKIAKILGKGIGEPSKKNEPRDIKREVEEAKHKLPNGKIFIPAYAFKAGIVEMTPYFENVNKKMMAGVQVLPVQIPIKYKSEEINRDVGRNQYMGKKIPVVIFRPQFNDWSCELIIKFDESLISPDRIVALLKKAGLQDGVGDFRPQRGGLYGMYEVKTV